LNLSTWVSLAQAAPPDLGEGFGWAAFKTLLVLVLIIALAYLTLNVGLRRLMGVAAMPMPGRSLLRVVDRLLLGQRQAVIVLKVAGEYWLVGTGPDGPVSFLGKLDTASVEQTLQQNKTTPPTSGGAGGTFLEKLLARKDKTS
jgi:flagellar protein FliO/FliZ